MCSTWIGTKTTTMQLMSTLNSKNKQISKLNITDKSKMMIEKNEKKKSKYLKNAPNTTANTKRIEKYLKCYNKKINNRSTKTKLTLHFQE
jgi:hypothetical protein